MILKHGDQRKLAEKAGVSPQYLNDILNGRKRCPSSLAVKLENISLEVIGELITSKTWILAGLGYSEEDGGQKA